MIGALAGRDVERAQLDRWMGEARSGSPRVVLVTGDAGIGKTALVSALAESSEMGTVAVGRTTELDGAPPFRPWSQILRTLGSESLLEPVADGGEHDRFARFDAVADQLTATAADDGLLVVLEDAHRADPPSIRLLVHVAEALTDQRVCLVVTARGRVIEQSEAFRAAVGSLSGQPGSRRLDLDGLDEDAVRAIAGADVDAASAARLAAVTGGNPLFLTALAQHLAEGGDPGRLPGSVVDLVRARVDARSGSCVEVLRLSSVIGREFAAGLVATALDIGAMACLEAIEEAERAGLVEPAGPAGWFRFVHVVVRDAVERDLGVRQLAEAHRRVALAIEAYEGSGEEHLADLARHWDAASVLGDAALAAAWCERAARAADRRLAWEDSARLYDRAIELDGPDADPLVRYRRCLGSARARLHVDDIGRTAQRCAEAADAVRALGRADLLAEAALVVEGRAGPALLEMRSLAEDALAACEADDFATRARLLGQLATCAFYLDPPSAGPLSAAATAAAAHSDDPLAAVAAARARQMSATGPESVEERLALAEVMADAGDTLRRPSVAQWGPIWRIDALVELGRLPDAVAELAILRHRVAEIRHPMSQFHLARCEGLLAQATGRFDDARLWCEQTCRLFARLEDPVGAMAMQAAFDTFVAMHTGFAPETAAVWDAFDLTQAPPFLGDLPVLHPLVAFLGVGDLPRARALYGRLAPVDAWRPPRFLWLHLHATRLWSAVGLGRFDDVEVLVAELGRHRGRHIAAGGGGMTYHGPVEVWTGIGAAALGRLDDAVADLRDAHRTCARIGAAAFAVHAGAELVRCLRHRTAPGDRAEARAMLDELTPQAAALGTTTLIDALDGPTPDPVGQAPGTLSRREMEVAALIARGLTNRAIAGELFVSERTAQNHVQHILTKLGLANRTQIAAWYTGR
jgi:DNA-binding CsgD family transcriptional regulator